MFLHCNVASRVSNYFLSPLSMVFVMSKSICDIFWLWGVGVKGGHSHIFFHALLQGIITWGIWKERNRKIFLGQEKGGVEGD